MSTFHRLVFPLGIMTPTHSQTRPVAGCTDYSLAYCFYFQIIAFILVLMSMLADMKAYSAGEDERAEMTSATGSNGAIWINFGICTIGEPTCAPRLLDPEGTPIPNETINGCTIMNNGEALAENIQATVGPFVMHSPFPLLLSSIGDLW